MRAITLWQPWATLVALGVKTVETRPGPAPLRLVGERVAIHAAARRPTFQHIPPRPRREAVTHQWTPWLVIDTVTDPAWQRPIQTHPKRERIPRAAKTPTLFRPHGGPHEGRYPDGRAEPGDTIELPLGAVVATARIAASVPMVGAGCVVGPSVYVPGEDATPDRPEGTLWTWQAPHGDDRHPYLSWCDITDQLPYGDYRPGRWAWLLEDIEPVEPPVPARGKQGWWTWNQAR